MRKGWLLVLLLCGLHAAQAQTGSTCDYWFDSDYAARETISLQGSSWNTEIDVSGLTAAVHTIHFQVTDASGTLSPAVSHLFVKLPQRTEPEVFTHDGTCRYWFDDDYGSGTTIASGAGLQTIDVGQLSPGVHTVHFQGGGSALTPTVSKLFVIMPAKDTANEKITGYDYWVNGNGTATSVVLPEPVAPLALVDLLPVAQQPLRSSCFHFAVEEGQPVVYAKNDLRLRFYTSATCFTDLKAQYVDYGVKATIGATELLQPNSQTTIEKPAMNTISWHRLTAEAGDLLRFRLDRAATLQVFAPSGQEVYAASGASSINWGETYAEETGTYYVALHDVTATKGTTLTIDYAHIDRYAVLSQDVTAVGNGGPSTITFKGNGFDALASVDLVQGTTTIGSAEMNSSGKATASVKFNFSEAPLGAYKAVFHFQDEDIVLENCIVVEPPIPTSLSVTAAYAKNFLVSRGNEYVFKVENLGNMTEYDIPLHLSIDVSDPNILTSIIIEGEGIVDVIVEKDSAANETRRPAPVHRISREFALGLAELMPVGSVSTAGAVVRYRVRPRGKDEIKVKVQTNDAGEVSLLLDRIGGSSKAVTSFDPNDIYGYQDADGDKTISGGLTSVWYTIEFENDPSFATAPAHDIYVTDQLSPEVFDLSTFAPTRVKIGNKEAELSGEKSGVVTISMLPELYALAQVEWEVDEQTGLATWHISSLDPMTVEPAADIAQGVLPVNTDGNGMGQLSFDISLKPSLPYSTVVSNKATITFDDNAPIETPTWTNTVKNVVVGDVNGDGVVNEVDAQMILDVSVGQKSLEALPVPLAIDVPGGNSEAYEVNAQRVLDYSVSSVKPW